MDGGQFGYNAQSAAAQTLGGIGGGIAGTAFIGGALYFGIDTFYPGGFNGAMQMNGSLIEQNQQILGTRFNLYRDN
jgi:hypothetical protein